MIIKIKIDNESNLDFDTEDLPLDDDFDSLLGIILEKNVSIKSRYLIAYAYKGHYELSKKIIFNIINNTRFEEQKKAYLFLLALNLQHNKETEEDFMKVTDLEDSVFVIIRGLYLAKKKKYLEALPLFNKENYKLGLDICNYHLFDNLNFNSFNKRIIKGLYILKTGDIHYFTVAKDIFVEYGLENILFRLGEGSSYSDSDNIDVKLTIANNLIKNKEFDKAKEMLLTIKDNPETLYLLGKISHLNKNYEEAKQFYVESIELERNIYGGLKSKENSNCKGNEYILSFYNLQRMVQEHFITENINCTSYSDFNAYMKYIKEEKDIDFTYCSEELKKYIQISMEVKNGSESYIHRYNLLLDNKLVDKYIIQNNIAYFTLRKTPYNKWDDETKNYCVNLLKNAIDCCPSSFQNVLKYNLGYVTCDLNLLQTIPFKEAKTLFFYLNKNVEGLNSYERHDLEASLIIDSDFGKATEILLRSKSLFSFIKLGNSYLKKYIENQREQNYNTAVQLYMKGLNSFKCANGIGICLALKKHYKEALKIFHSVVLDDKETYCNVGNVYLLQREYEMACKEFIKIPLNSYTKQMILRISGHVKDINMLIYCYQNGLEELKEVIFEHFILQNNLEEANNYKVENENLMKLYGEKCKEHEEKIDAHKRKMKEIEEYKKRRNIK